MYFIRQILGEALLAAIDARIRDLKMLMLCGGAVLFCFTLAFVFVSLAVYELLRVSGLSEALSLGVVASGAALIGICFLLAMPRRKPDNMRQRSQHEAEPAFRLDALLLAFLDGYRQAAPQRRQDTPPPEGPSQHTS